MPAVTVALTFGALGDIVSLWQILNGVLRALRDRGGSLKGYEKLVNGVSAFQVLLSQVSKLELGDFPLEFRNALKLHLSLAEEAAKTFLSRIGGHHASLSAGTGRRVRDSWRRLWWEPKEQDKKEFEDQMKSQVIAIGVLLSTGNMFVCTCIPPLKYITYSQLIRRMLINAARSDDDRHHRELKRGINQVLETHRAYFGEIMDSFIQKLLSERVARNTWDHNHDQWPILFTDAMGAKRLLPFHLCIAYKVCNPP